MCENEISIAWVRGNTAMLNISLYDINTDGTETPVNLDGYDNVTGNVYKLLGRGFRPCKQKKTQVEGVEQAISGNVLTLVIPSSLTCGVYSVEVLLRHDDTDRRSYEVPIFGVVETNAEAHVTYEMIDGMRAADLDMKFQLVESSLVRGKNAYEMWRELPGNEGKTLQDFIDEVVNLNGITSQANTAIANMNTLSNTVSTQEAARVQAEGLREAAETTRSNAETARGTAETQRAQAETQRAAAEQTRQTAEGQRNTNEGQRQNNEQARSNAEALRVQAESQRQQAFQTAISNAEQATLEAENVNAQLSSDGGVVILTITNRQGNQTSKEVGFRIYKTYPSVAAMNADLANVEEGRFVMIAGSTEEVDTGKLFVRSASAFTFITDLSGAQGIKGDTGNGIASVTLNADYTLTIVFTDGTSTTTTSIRGEKGEQGIQGIQGEKGEKGDTGEKGEKGDKGDAGTTNYNDLTNKPDLSVFIEKSQTAGLVKNDGTIDTNTYLTQHQDISGKEDKSNKVTSFSSPTDTQYPSAKLVSDQLATKQDTISDLSTIRSNATAGATAYQKPHGGIPKTDLAQGVKDSLDKADSALQEDTLYVKVNNNGHEYVDLGLPSGTLWAKCNVGADTETGYGNYYMYGKGARQYNSSDSPYTGTEDPLDLSVDTARQVLGGSWHMPTRAQMQELTANTTYQWVTNYKGSGINGGTFTATNGAVLFIPAAGKWDDGSQYDVGNIGRYWGSSPLDSDSAYYLYFSNGHKGVYNYNRKYGYSVRGVILPDTTQLKKDLDSKANTEDLADVAFSGSYNDLEDKPTIPTVPTNVSAFNNDAGYLTQHQDISGKQDTLVSGTNIKTINNESILGSGNITIQGGGGSQVQSDWNQSDNTAVDYIKNKPTIPVIPSNLAYTSNDNGEGIIPSDGIRAVTVTSAATMTISPDVVTIIDGAVGTAAITLQVPQDNLAHVWDILMTTDSTVAITFAMSNSETILTPSGFSIGASKAVEISVIGVGTKYYLRYGEFA